MTMAVEPHIAREALPVYAGELRAFHEAFASELRACVETLQLPPAARVLDVPCGDGFFTEALARLMTPNDELVAADLSPEYLAEAERMAAGVANGPRLRFVEADAYRLPFDDDSFDLVFCAQSMISLPDPVGALNEFRRVTKPGGRVAILENDELHHVLFNWPVELELEVGRAMRIASRERYGSRQKLFATRNMRSMFRSAGFQPLHRRTFTADRHSPFPPATRTFLEHHLARIIDLASPHLSESFRKALTRFASPDSPEYLLDQPDADATYLWTFYQGRNT